MTTMIALVGEQPLPNFLPVRHYQRTKHMRDLHVLLVYTETTKQHHTYLRDKLEMEIAVSSLKTDPYDIPIIVKDINEYVNKLDAHKQITGPFEFNLTGGTKPMSLAAYQVAAQLHAPILYLQSEDGQSVIDYYAWQDNYQLIYQRRDILAECVELDDILEIHLGPQKDRAGKSRWAKEVDTSDDSVYGHLFEVAIAEALSNSGYEAAYGIKDMRPRVNMEMDVVFRYQNQLGIIEAKTAQVKDGKVGEVGEFKGFFQLIRDMRYINGTYIKPFLVIAGKVGDSLSIICKEFDIPIIHLPHYKRGPQATSLPFEDQDILLSEVKKIMQEG